MAPLLYVKLVCEDRYHKKSCKYISYWWKMIKNKLSYWWKYFILLSCEIIAYNLVVERHVINKKKCLQKLITVE